MWRGFWRPGRRGIFNMTQKPIRHHLSIASGLLLLAIFAYRGFLALREPGLGLMEIYCLGGLVFGAALIFDGLRSSNDTNPD